MNVLVTGSGGFLGKLFVRFLEDNGVAAITYDLVDGEDLLDANCLVHKMKTADMVVHLAAVGDVYQAAQNPAKAAVSGTAGTANLVKAANECKIKKIIYVSTWEVYGEPKYQPVDEIHPCLPDHPYSISKYGGELMVRSKLNRIPWVILRLGSAYGPSMRPHAVIPLFIRKALRKETIILQGGGGQHRQFTHTDDINRAVFQALRLPVKNEIFNIVNSKTASIRQIAELIAKTIPVKITVGEQREGEVPSSVVSSKKAARILKWKAQIPLRRGIQGVISELSESSA